nr:hypothetical protein [Tanacetum cinerariifolium]
MTSEKVFPGDMTSGSQRRGSRVGLSSFLLSCYEPQSLSFFRSDLLSSLASAASCSSIVGLDIFISPGSSMIKQAS